jgi:hypothetical protein
MEVNNKQPYESPEMEIVEVKPEGYILAGSKPDYIPEEW